MSVITNSLAMMDTSSAVTGLDADAVVYDNTTSGLTATDAQAAIDELDSTIDTISTEIGSLNAADIEYTKTIPGEYSISPVAITNVQEAFDYLLSVDTAHPVPSRIVNYYDSSGFLFYNTYSVQEALTKVDGVLSDFLENTGSGEYILPANNIVIPSASKTGIYANADDVQDALDAIKTALDSGSGGGSVDASDVTFDIEKGCWGGACAGSVEDALFDLNDRIEALSGGGGGGSGSSTAADVSFTRPQSSIYESDTDNVQEALEDVNTTIDNLQRSITTLDTYVSHNLSADKISYSSACSGRGGMEMFGLATTVDEALYEVEDFVNNRTNTNGDILSTKVAYTKPQNSIYSSGTDTVAEALDDVSTVIQALDSTDIAIPTASKTGIYANTATVQAALDAIKTAISSGGGGGSSSATNVSFTKPQGGIYGANTDTVQEALEDVSAKIIYLEASDIGFLGSGCGGGYPTDVGTVQDALNALEHLLFKYSEYEAETGLLWFNDKPIYQISVEPESNVTNLFDTSELEIDDLVYMEATLTNSGGTKRWTISGSSGDFYWDTTTHMIVYGGSDVITTATIRYTKTSD